MSDFPLPVKLAQADSPTLQLSLDTESAFPNAGSERKRGQFKESVGENSSISAKMFDSFNHGGMSSRGKN
jgi:hypothetical protein